MIRRHAWFCLGLLLSSFTVEWSFRPFESQISKFRITRIAKKIAEGHEDRLVYEYSVELPHIGGHKAFPRWEGLITHCVSFILRHQLIGRSAGVDAVALDTGLPNDTIANPFHTPSRTADHITDVLAHKFIMYSNFCTGDLERLVKLHS